MYNPTKYELYIINQIELGLIKNHLANIVVYPEKRRNYYTAINTLKQKEIVMEYHGQLTINISSKEYQKLKSKIGIK